MDYNVLHSPFTIHIGNNLSLCKLKSYNDIYYFYLLNFFLCICRCVLCYKYIFIHKYYQPLPSSTIFKGKTNLPHVAAASKDISLRLATAAELHINIFLVLIIPTSEADQADFVHALTSKISVCLQ